MLEITVTDDGAGIDPLRRYRRDMASTTRASGCALYGDAASLEILRRPEGGTIAVLRVPYRETDEGNGG